MVNMVTDQSPSNNASADFGKFMKYNLVSTLPSQVGTRLIEGKNLIIRSLDGTREMNANDWSSILLPLLSGVLFIIAINISSGYLLQAVVEEKENRTMEILVTSVSPTQLMAGKISGDLLVGLTQLIVWILFAIIGLQIAPRYLPIDLSFSISGSQLSILALTFLPAFILISGLMGAVGGISTDVREAQQISSIFSLPMIIPYWFITPIMFNPNGPVALGMSLFPLTAPVVLPMRVVFTTVPAWQIILSIGLLWLFAVLSMRLAGMVFRRGMLQYGKRLSFKQVFQRGS
jgi:ABC-2 type transport system permease protein